MNKRIRVTISLMLCAFLATGCAKAGAGAAQPPAEQQTAAQQPAEQQTAAQPPAEQQTAVQPPAEQRTAEQATTAQPATDQPAAEQKAPDQPTYTYTEYPLERNGIPLHLDCVKLDNSKPKETDAPKDTSAPKDNSEPKDNILLMHGSTYSSHEFDINYEDYSLVRRLAREGYAVWRLDVAGYGQSGKVEDGLMPDTAYAAEDIRAAMELISNETGMDKIDLLGWSWGTMTTGLYAAEYPEHLDKLVLYAPILSGIGEAEITEPFNHNDWAGAAEDFQTKEDGSFDLEVTDPVLIEMFCSSCWHYDGDSSPNAWRKDALVSEDNVLIDLTKITVPTLVICGDKDPYLNMDLVKTSTDLLPDGSELKVIPGGSHIVLYEKNCYREFQDSVAAFLTGE